MSFVQDRIQDAPTRPSDLSRPPEDYVRLLKRVQEEARREQAHARAWELARQQGVKPIRSIKELQGDFWPEEESVDEFLNWLDALRGNDKPRSIPE